MQTAQDRPGSGRKLQTYRDRTALGLPLGSKIKMAIYAAGDSPKVKIVRNFSIVSGSSDGRGINEVHVAAGGSLSGDSELVTWISSHVSSGTITDVRFDNFDSEYYRTTCQSLITASTEGRISGRPD